MIFFLLMKHVMSDIGGGEREDQPGRQGVTLVRLRHPPGLTITTREGRRGKYSHYYIIYICKH